MICLLICPVRLYVLLGRSRGNGQGHLGLRSSGLEGGGELLRFLGRCPEQHRVAQLKVFLSHSQIFVPSSTPKKLAQRYIETVSSPRILLRPG